MTRRYDAGFTYDGATGLSVDTSQDWSMCGYVYVGTLTAAGGDLCFLAEYDGAPSELQSYLGWGFNGGNPVLRYTCGDGSTRVLNRYQAITTGAWYHMALVYDATANTVTAYLDAVQVEQQSITMGYTFTFAEFGDFVGGNDLEIAQVKVWAGYALSAGEVADEMAYWTPQNGTSFVEAWWQFDNADQLSDSSGNGLTITNIGNNPTPPGSPRPGVQTVPGQLNPSGPTLLPVAAVGGAVSNGTAVVRARYRVQAAGGAMSGASAWVSTNVAPAGGGASSFGGRARKRRGRR